VILTFFAFRDQPVTGVAGKASFDEFAAGQRVGGSASVFMLLP
jgi:hypothetical protein